MMGFDVKLSGWIPFLVPAISKHLGSQFLHLEGEGASLPCASALRSQFSRFGLNFSFKLLFGGSELFKTNHIL